MMSHFICILLKERNWREVAAGEYFPSGGDESQLFITSHCAAISTDSDKN